MPTACTVAHSCTQVILCEASGGRSKYQCVECYAVIVVEDDENTISELPKIENSWTAAGTPTVSTINF